MLYLNQTLDLIKRYKLLNKKQLLWNVKKFHDIIYDKWFFVFDKSSNNKEYFDGKWIFDLRRVFLNSKWLQLASEIFWDIYEKDLPFNIASIELWWVPLMMWIISQAQKKGIDINWLIVRKERKKRGFYEIIEWEVDKSSRIILVDDLVNSWESVLYWKKVLESDWYKICSLFSLISFQSQSFQKFLKKNDLDYRFVYVPQDFGVGKEMSSTQEKTYIDVEPKLVFEAPNPNPSLMVPKSSPAYDWSNVYLGWEWWIFYCIDKKWKIIWKHNIIKHKFNKNILSSPVLYNEYVIFWAYDGNLYVLKKKDWKIFTINSDADWIGSSPCVSSKWLIYVWKESTWSKKWSLLAINLARWDTIWEYKVDDYIHSSPIFIEEFDLVVCWTNCGKIICNNWTTWKLIWEYNLWNPMKWGFVSSWKKIFFWSFDKKVYCFDAQKGTKLRDYATEDIIYSWPCIFWENLFIWSLDKNLYHFDLSWNLKAKIVTTWKILSTPIVVKDKYLVFGNNDSKIYFYDIENCRIVFYHQHIERITTKMFFDKKSNSIFYYDFMNKLWTFKLPEIIC